MGRTVINQTENKQTIILNDSAEGVSGGYFDDEMLWHDLTSEESVPAIEQLFSRTAPSGKFEFTHEGGINSSGLNGFRNITGAIVHGASTITQTPESTQVSPFANMPSLKILVLPDLTSISGYNKFENSFTNDGVLVMPKLNGGQYQTLGQGCKIKILDLGEVTPRIPALNQCSNLSILILRNEEVVSMNNTNDMNNTHFKSGGPGGEIYVPSALIDSYKVASNWSTYEGYGTITWKALEGSLYEDPDWWKTEWEAL